ncbi:MAG: alkyl hydroperoxide reductase/thiol specific antioxidant/Mal allergen [Limisphaerales bacterium]|nr:MAG: alkyl hydroperoxide reductase/thiol specific antioxidant/Mal allergen [Limisphaerales bacterium]TXT45674.1 MAG: alkyl hydroperoxide reductase/thiol specific antioxidant/Mal allergen [Limisphaerales bacterium]
MNPTSAPSPSRSRLLRRLLIALVVVSVLAVTFGREGQRRLGLWLVLRNDSTTGDAIRAVTLGASDPMAELRRLWETGKVPHRFEVVRLLKELADKEPAWRTRAEPLLREATLDADLAVRELAFGALSRVPSSGLVVLAQRQLSDADPHVRLLGISQLRRLPSAQAIAVVFPLLDDPEPQVVAATAGAMRHWTGQDFGIRAPGHFTSGGDAAEKEAAKRREGVLRWKAWHAANPDQVPPLVDLATSRAPQPLPGPPVEFCLGDVEGRPVSVAQFRGKVVLLNFWTTWCPSCVQEIPDLVALQRKRPDDLAVVGVSLDGAPDGHDHSHGDDDHEHGADPAKVRAKLQRFAREKGLTYLLLHDAQGEVGARFLGHELPTNVLLDPQGRVRRRFLGTRSVAAFEAMLDELR